jgi:transposase-like protein
MDTLQERGLLEGLAVRDDGTIDLTELARRALESVLNQVMDAQADELCGEGNRRNGYRERRLPAVVGEVTLRIPKPGEGSYFPDELPGPYSRVDRATVACVHEAYVRGLSTRKTGAAADALELGSPSSSRASRMTADLDEEVAAMRAERFDGLRFPYLWLDATYVRRGDEGSPTRPSPAR